MTDNVVKIKKINKTIVHEDGTIDSLDKQLLKLMDGKQDIRYPLVIDHHTNCLNYIEDINVDNPLVINVSTVIKLKNKHNLGFSDIAEIENLLSESVIAFDSLTQETSKVIVLDRFDKTTNEPMLAICRLDKLSGYVSLNEITSLYDKSHFKNFLINTYEQEKRIFKNKKTERYFESVGLQLPLDLRYALSSNYDRTSFTKSQVEQDIRSKKLVIKDFLNDAKADGTEENNDEKEEYVEPEIEMC